MKKIYILIITVILIVCAVSCSNSKTYKNGDRVTIDGLIYEYNIPSVNEETRLLDAPVYDYKTADITAEDKPIYHSCYPIDMLHPEKYVISDSDLSKENWLKYSYQAVEYSTCLSLDENYTTITKYFNPVTKCTRDEMAAFPINRIDKNYIWDNPCFWVVGATDELKKPADEEESFIITSIDIPRTIDGVVVAGIGYGALKDIAVMDIEIESLSSIDLGTGVNVGTTFQIPFYIMPYALNDSIIGHIQDNRATYIYSRAINNVEVHDWHFNRTTFVFDASFYNFRPLEVYDKVYDGCAQEESKTISFEYLAYPSTGYNTSPLINGVFVDCDFKGYDNGYRVIYNTNDFYGTIRTEKKDENFDRSDVLFDALLSNYHTEPLLFGASDIVELTLTYSFLSSNYIENKEIKSYITEEALVTKLEKVYLMGKISKNIEDEATFYLDEENNLYFLSYQTLDKSPEYIKVFKAPTNCEFMEVEVLAEDILFPYVHVM